MIPRSISKSLFRSYAKVSSEIAADNMLGIREAEPSKYENYPLLSLVSLEEYDSNARRFEAENSHGQF